LQEYLKELRAEAQAVEEHILALALFFLKAVVLLRSAVVDVSPPSAPWSPFPGH